MFCPDPRQALREAYRVLRSGGRVAFATWDEPAKSPFFDVITAVATCHLSITPPSPLMPGPFRLSSPMELDAMLRSAGFEKIRVESRSMSFEFDSAEQYCELFADVAWRSRVASLTEQQLTAFREEVRRAAKPYVKAGRLRLIAASLCASGRKL